MDKYLCDELKKNITIKTQMSNYGPLKPSCIPKCAIKIDILHVVFSMYFYIAPLDNCEPVEVSVRRLGYLFEKQKNLYKL